MYLNGTKLCSLLAGCALSFSLSAKNEIPAAGQSLAKPLCFTENRGQITDENKQVRGDVQYTLSTPGMSLMVGNGQLHYQFKKIESSTETTYMASYERVDVTLVGANASAVAVPSGKLDYYENYFLGTGNDAVTVHTYEKITYKDVYPNIDWVLYVNKGSVEYDFVVREGGNAADIKLKYDGADNMKLAKDGSIHIKTQLGSINEKTPYAYDSKTHQQVDARFVMNDNVISFDTKGRKSGITIDPYLLWSTYFGGTGEDVATCVRTFTGNLTYVGGYTSSTGLGTTGSTHPAYWGGTYDGFIAKYNNSGVLQFATYIGTTVGGDKVNAIALDATGANIYIGGIANATGIPAPVVVAFHSLYDGFVFKLNNTGATKLWATYFGGTADDYVNGIALDASNNVYITGQTASATTISSGSVYQVSLSGPTDAFLAKLSSTTGALTWATYYGGTAQEEGLGVACDASGNIVITGQTNSVIGVASTGAHKETLDGTNDAFVAKFNTSGALLWATYYGGTGTEAGNGVACDQVTGDVLVVGNTTSTDNISTPKAHQPSYGGGVQDAFVTSFSSAGVQNWGSYYGGVGLDYGQAVALDVNRNIMIAGGTFSSNGIASLYAYQTAIGGDYDAYLAKFNRLGQRMWGTYFGNTLYDYAFGVANDNATSQPVIVGHTTSTGGISTAGVSQTAFAGGTYDGFVTKFRADTVCAITQPFNDTIVCASGTFNLNYTVNFSFAAGNTFTAQLSNASGSFASPVNIGSATATGAGSIACTIPSSTPAGTGYRIRIVSSAPSYVSPDDYFDIQILSTPPDVVAASNSPVCVGNTVSLTATSSYTISSYTWTGPAGSGFASSLQNPTIPSATTSHSGTYTLTTTHTGCPADVSTVDVTVNSFIPPAPTVSSSSPNCIGSDISLFSNSTLGTTPVSYHWTGPAGFTSTMQNPTVTAATSANAGWYYVNDTLGGCASARDSVQITMTATTPVSITIDLTPNDTICAGTMVTFTATSVNEGISPTYQWMSGSALIVGAISSSWSSSTLADGQSIWCQLHSSITCPSPINAPSNAITMHVIDNPPMAFISASPGTSVAPGSTVTFTSVVYNGGTAPMYQWKLNGLPISGETNPTYVRTGIVHNDTISMDVASNMTCASPSTATSNALVIHVGGVGVNNINTTLEDVSLFPNPNTGTFNLNGIVNGADVQEVNYEVLNAVGQVVYMGKANVKSSVLNATIELNNCPNGIYMLHLAGEGASRVIRFTVER